jgi:copper transport protein
VAIALSGVIQAYIDVRSIAALFDSTYGLLVVAKVVLLLALIALGAVNRDRLVPAIRRLAASASAPGRVGVAARRSFRAELALMIVVFGVTAALVTYTPPVDAAQGPFSTSVRLGPAELEMTVEPATVGLNTVHLYLINPSDGTQFTRTKQLTATATLPAQKIGPLPLRVDHAGPGHYILSDARLSPGGSWELKLTDRVSAFDEYTTSVSVPIR